MPANTTIPGTELVENAIDRLTSLLGPALTVRRSKLRGGRVEATDRADAFIEIRGRNGQAVTVAVEAKRSVTPRDAERLLAAQAEALRRSPGVPLLVVARWLSPRAREVLEAREINYLDLTGSTRLRLDEPTVYLRTDGAARDPEPAERAPASLRGAKAGRLVRVLADVRPPYGVRPLSAKANLAPGYVSRLLDTLDREALVSRDKRGAVEDVDIAGLLRRYAESYDTFKTNDRALFIAKTGATSTLRQLRDVGRPVAVTGSFAAARIAPVAAPTLLAVYSQDVRRTARALKLLPASEGANVALLRPFDPVVWDRVIDDDGTTYVAPSQVALDCLAGNGRMPAEGEAVLSWLTENELTWRVPSLADAAPFGEGTP
jgi:hypothetical protein